VLTGPRRFTQKRWRHCQKCVLQSLARSRKKYTNKKTFEHDISPLCRGGSAWPIFTIFGVWGRTADVITDVKFELDWSKGFGATGAPNRVFPIDFDRRPYNSVMHYRATL